MPFCENPAEATFDRSEARLALFAWHFQFGMHFESDKNNDKLIGYVDSDWVNDPETRRSITAYVLKFAKGAITIKSKRQPSVSTSSMQVGY